MSRSAFPNVTFVPPVESTTAAPSTGLPEASRTVTVTTDVPLPATIDDGAALTLDMPASGGPPGPPPPPSPATSSIASSPALADLLNVAETALRFAPHSASSSVLSPEPASAISANPVPGVAAGAFVPAPSTPSATLLALPSGARTFESDATAFPLADPVCPMAPAPFVPV